MKPKPVLRDTAFDLLGDETAALRPAADSGAMASIAPTGINLLFPAADSLDYSRYLSREISLKHELHNPKGPIGSLWLRGFPFRHLTADTLTELIFRLCTRVNLEKTPESVRGIELTPEDCGREQLALIKGLGFGVVRLRLDARIAADDRSLDKVSAVLERIKDFRDISVQSEVLISSDTAPRYLNRLIEGIKAHCEEIELVPDNGACEPEEDTNRMETLLLPAANNLMAHGFQMFGESCFKSPEHGDVILRHNKRLRYAPWGYYNLSVSQWLGLGVGAAGISSGFFYRNLGQLTPYLKRIDRQQSPVASWSCRPLDSQFLYRFLQESFCYRHLFCEGYRLDPEFIAELRALGWLEDYAHPPSLTTLGALNLRHILRRIATAKRVVTWDN